MLCTFLWHGDGDGDINKVAEGYNRAMLAPEDVYADPLKSSSLVPAMFVGS